MKNDESLALAYRGDSTAPCENYWMQNNEMGLGLFTSTTTMINFRLTCLLVVAAAATTLAQIEASLVTLHSSSSHSPVSPVLLVCRLSKVCLHGWL